MPRFLSVAGELDAVAGAKACRPSARVELVILAELGRAARCTSRSAVVKLGNVDIGVGEDEPGFVGSRR